MTFFCFIWFGLVLSCLVWICLFVVICLDLFFQKRECFKLLKETSRSCTWVLYCAASSELDEEILSVDCPKGVLFLGVVYGRRPDNDVDDDVFLFFRRDVGDVVSDNVFGTFGEDREMFVVYRSSGGGGGRQKYGREYRR